MTPSFSPDGNQVVSAWSTGADDKFDLYLKVVGNEKALRLTTHPARFVTPAWSPDGRFIAFLRVANDGRGIYMIPALGGHERKLADVINPAIDYAFSTVISWSPDGRWLAFADTDKPSRPIGIMLLDVETLHKRRLPDPSDSCNWVWAPAFSPDGRSIAVACSLDIYVNNDLYTVPVSGGAARRLAQVKGAFHGLTWTADGNSVLFVKSGDIWRVKAAGGEPAMALSGVEAFWPVVSHLGNRLAFATGRGSINIWRVTTTDDSNRPANAAEKLVASSHAQHLPALSPDGSRLAFLSTRSGATEIWVSAADGSDPMRVTSFQGPLTGSPQWSPDGRQIVLDSRASGRAGIYVVHADGGPSRQVVTGADESQEPCWSHDGRWLYFTGKQGGRDQVWKVTPAGEGATQLTSGGGVHPRESADGLRVFYVKSGDEAEFWSVSVNGGDERPVPDMPRLNPKWYADWVPTSNGIYFIDGSLSRPAIQFYDFDTRRVRRVVALPGKPAEWAGGLAVSRDERTFLFSQVDEATSDLMLVENFR
jgi:Tol biopolymer transport system component